MSQARAETEAKAYCEEMWLSSYEKIKDIYMSLKDRLLTKKEVIQAVRHEQKMKNIYIDYKS